MHQIAKKKVFTLSNMNSIEDLISIVLLLNQNKSFLEFRPNKYVQKKKPACYV